MIVRRKLSMEVYRLINNILSGENLGASVYHIELLYLYLVPAEEFWGGMTIWASYKKKMTIWAEIFVVISDRC